MLSKSAKTAAPRKAVMGKHASPAVVRGKHAGGGEGGGADVSLQQLSRIERTSKKQMKSITKLQNKLTKTNDLMRHTTMGFKSHNRASKFTS